MQTRTKVDVGVSKQKQYAVDGSARHHVVVSVYNSWVLLCTKTPGTREYLGWLETSVTCVDCKKIMAKKLEEQ